jgi:hypothetical protein
MTYTDRLFSSDINQPLAGILVNDDLLMSPSSDKTVEPITSASPGQNKTRREKPDKNQKLDKSDTQVFSNSDSNSNIDYLRINNFSGINQRINNTSSKEKPQVYNLALSDEETGMLASEVSNDLLVMHLKFEQTSGTQITDSSPSGNNKGELRNGATFNNVGATFGNVVSFDGGNDYIYVNDSNKINLGTYAKRTISLWFKVNNKNISNRKQVIYEEGGSGRGFNIYVYNGRLYVGAWNNPTSQSNWQGTYLSTSAISSNQWHHVILVLDAQPGVKTLQSGVLRAYLDGVKFGTGKGSQVWSHGDDIGIGGINQNTQFHDGDKQGTATHTLAGSVDEVRVYNRALTDAEIAALATQASGTTNTTNTVPVALSDTATTNEDTPITILASNLLANDTDANGDLLKIIGVSNATNGTAVLNSNGNVTFNPTANFSGNASFQYTINDSRGGKATATVTVSVLEQPEPPTTSVQIGTNLNGINDWSTQLPFLDGFKSSRRWITHNKSTWNTNESDKLNLDANGWVKSLPNAGDGLQYTSVGTLLYREIGDRYPGGKYVVLYDGEGTIEYSFDAKKDWAASSPRRDVIDVTPSDSGIWVKITATDPNKTGNYLRNIRVIPATYENSYQSQIFNPDFINKVNDFSAFRFMDWMETNNSSQSQWSNRPTPQTVSYAQRGSPVEIMVELANQTDTDPWFCMPHMATDEYVTNFATYVRDHLESGRKVYVEYSNEVWNWGFGQSQWVLQQAKNEWSSSNDSDYAKKVNWFSRRTTQITQIWDRVFGANKERVIGVMGAQAANVWVAQQALSYDWTTTPLSHADYGIDAIAIAPYFAQYIGNPENASQVESWTYDSDGGLNKLFDEITKGGVLSNGPQGGSLQQSYDWIQKHVALAKQENLQLVAYEGGQHLAGMNGVENNAAINKLFIDANRDARMGDIYREYFQKWFELGGGLFVNYSDIAKPSMWGSWGLLEYANQSSSPKYDAIMDIIHSS